MSSNGKGGHDADLEHVGAKLKELAEQGRVDELVTTVIELLSQVRQQNTALQVRLHNALRQLYGRKSEKVSADQLSLLFAELGDQVPEGARPDAEDNEGEHGQDEPIEQPKRKARRGRKPLPKDLPREQKVIRVPAEQRACPKCGCERSTIGFIESEVLEFVPAHFKVIEEQREKVACEQCGDGVAAAQTQKPLERGRPGPGLLAHVLVSKCQDSLPLYRQSQIYERAGVRISPSTLGDWFAFGCDVLEPIADEIRRRVLGSLVIRADDTSIRVLDRADAKGVKRGHMWGYVGDGGLVVFDYTPTWEAKGPAAFLEGFDGWLQGDGYAGFKTALGRQRDGPIVSDERRLGCSMHVRRKFEYAAKAGDTRGAVALGYFRKIYRVEKECKREGLDAEQRKARRDEQSLPVLNEMYEWIHKLHRDLIPDDKLQQATRYAINEEAPIRRCFEDGRFEIDNGEVERQLRRIAIGRKNYLFAGSDKGAHRLARACTVLGSCHMLGIDPQAYLTDVIDKVQNGWPKSRIDALMPTTYAAAADEDTELDDSGVHTADAAL